MASQAEIDAFKESHPKTIDGVSDAQIAGVITILQAMEGRFGTSRWSGTTEGRTLFLLDLIRMFPKIDLEAAR